MTALFLTLMLLQAQPAQDPAATATAPAKTPAETLAGLEQVYASTCTQTGILYYSYADLCDGLRQQIGAYRAQADREARTRAPAPKPSTSAEPPRP